MLNLNLRKVSSPAIALTFSSIIYNNDYFNNLIVGSDIFCIDIKVYISLYFHAKKQLIIKGKLYIQ